MVRILLIIFYLAFTSVMFSTDFGLSLGGGLAQAYGSKEQAVDYDIDIKPYPVFRAGLFAEYLITDNMSLVQEVIYSQKGSKQTIKVKDQPVNFDLQYDLYYIEVPFLIKYDLFKLNQTQIRSFVGFSFSYLLDAYYDLDGSVQIGTDDDMSIVTLQDSYRMKNLDEFDYSLLYGFTTDLQHLGIPIGLEYRFSLSWYKINFPTYSDMEPVVLSNQSHILTFNYKFWN